jgi:beta-galactosidase
MAKYLLPGETIPEPPASNPVTAVARFEVGQSAGLFDNLPAPIQDIKPRNMEAYDQGHGCTVYRTTIPAGPAATLQVKDVRDFAWVFVDGKRVGTMDRRFQQDCVALPARGSAARLDVLVEAVGHVNFGPEVHDRKGLYAPVRLVTPGDAAGTELTDWQVFCLGLDRPLLDGLKWKNGKTTGPAFWRGTFNVDKVADTFLDVRPWGKGVVWINGRCLGRFWNIGPTQTMYVPGPWLKAKGNEVIVLDLIGPEQPALAGLEKPILDQLRPQLDFSSRSPAATLALDGVTPAHTGTFAPGPAAQEIHFAQPVEGRQFCLETLNAFDGKPFAAVAELDLLDAAGVSIPHTTWTTAFVDSEEAVKEDGSALNAINGQTADYWHTEWGNAQPGHPHRLVIDLGGSTKISGFRYTPRAGGPEVTGWIKDYRVYVGMALAKPIVP